MKAVQFLHKGLVEIEEVSVLVDERHGRHFLLYVVELPDAWIVDKSAWLLLSGYLALGDL